MTFSPATSTTPIRDLKSLPAHADFAGLFLLRSKTLKTAKNGNPYLAAEFGDRTGSFSSTLFNDNPAYATLTSLSEGTLVRISGRTDLFGDKFSPRLASAEPISQDDADYAAALDALAERSPEDLDAMWEEFQSHIAAIPHSGLRAVVESVFSEIGDTFRTSPAAVSMHHAYRGGLLEHTLRMARACRALLPLYPEIHGGLALAGILLHDTGKVVEYSQGLVTRRTRSGILHGHVVLGYALARKHGLRHKLDDALLERLEHIILSHQGELEWGAAAMAATPEAVFVSMVDNLDARLGMVQKALRDAPSGSEFSERIAGLKAPLLLMPVRG